MIVVGAQLKKAWCLALAYNDDVIVYPTNINSYYAHQRIRYNLFGEENAISKRIIAMHNLKW